MSDHTSLQASRRSEFLAGARDSLPMLIGAAPFGMIFGALAEQSGVSTLGALAMSALVFAGSSQFIALTLFKGHAALGVIWLTTLIVNLRHALYSVTLLPHVGKLSQRWRLPLAFGLTDETFAVVQHRYNSHDPSPYKHWYYLGSVLAMYSNWQLWTAAGLILGQSVKGLENLGLDFAMVATFVGIVVPMLKTPAMRWAALAAAVVALAAHGLPYKLGLMLAALAGVVTGVWCESRPTPRQDHAG